MTDRTASLQTQHFLMQVFLWVEFDKQTSQSERQRCDVKALMTDAELGGRFSAMFCEHMAAAHTGGNLDEKAENVQKAMRAPSSVAMNEERTARRPWISRCTLRLIEERELCRKLGSADADVERNLHRRVRASVKQDRKQWLEGEMHGGPWSAVKALRKGTAKKPIQVRDASGSLVDSDKRGDTMADYFETIQWKISFADVVPTGTANLGPTLPVSTEQFCMS